LEPGFRFFPVARGKKKRQKKSEDLMKNSENRMPVAKLPLLLVLIPALLALNGLCASQSVTMPRMREMTSMQDHHSHPQQRQTAATLSADDRAPAFTFNYVDVPSASATLATGINSRGHIVGIYYDTAGNEHGFLLKKGTSSTVDVPGSLVGLSGTLQTEANGCH
jgi:hypothetical protein